MVGDRMDTDVVAGLESGLDTVLVLSGGARGRQLRNTPTGPNMCSTELAISYRENTRDFEKRFR